MKDKAGPPRFEISPPSTPSSAQVEGDFLSEPGLPNRPWFKHTIYAPGEYTGYAAVVIPGVNEAIDAKDSARAQQQMTVLTAAINRAEQTLETAAK